MSSLPPELMEDTTKVWYYDNPSKIMDSVTTTDLDDDPELAAYFASNFPKPPPTLGSIQTNAVEVETSRTRREAAKNVVVDDDLATLNVRRLRCFPRDPATEDGSRPSRRMRVTRRLIPGIIYGSDGAGGGGSEERVWVKTPHSEIHRETDRYGSRFSSRVYQLSVVDPDSGDLLSEHRVIPRDVNMHPYLNKPYCVNYLRYRPGRPVDIPIRYVNTEESPALKRGAFVIPIKRHLECTIEEGVPIPEWIDCDCTGAKLKDKLRLDRLVIPEGVNISKNVNQKDFLVGPIAGRRKDAGVLDSEDDED